MSTTPTVPLQAEQALSADTTLTNVEVERRRPPGQRLVRWLLGAIPTLAVLAALGGIGYWGHVSGWKIPKFSELYAQGEAEGIKWCDQHGVPEAECVACNPELMPKGELFGWCEEHGIHECVLHHPKLAQLKEPPILSQTDFDRAARAIALRSRSQNDPACKVHLRRIQFPSIAAMEKAGIDVSRVDRGRVVETISAAGEIVYDPTHVARLGSRVAGTVWRVNKNVGDKVHEGDVLALIDAADVGKAKAELLDALAKVDFHSKTNARIAPLFEEQIVTGNRMLEVESALQQASIQLRRAEQALNNLGLTVSIHELKKLPDAERASHIRFLGLPDEVRSQILHATISNNLIPVVASFNGIVTRREAVIGEIITPSQMLFQIADTSRMWVMLNVLSEEAMLVAAGQKVLFWPDGDNHGHSGELTWISTEVDSETRTIKVRGEIHNEDGHLRNKSFGKGQIVLREEEEAIIVPSTAVHWEGCCHVVFVRDKDFMKGGSFKVFHTRSVRPGVAMGDHTEMIAGLLPKEVVVTGGSAVLRAELLKGNLGAG